jgi:transcriptional regulator with XRE-family HTH domain
MPVLEQDHNKMQSVVKQKNRKPKRFAGLNLENNHSDPWYIRLQKARLKAGITQREFSQIIGVSHTAVCLWEKGVNFPSSKKLDNIEKILNTSIFDRKHDVHMPAREPDHIKLIRVFMQLPIDDRAIVLAIAFSLIDRDRYHDPGIT